MPDAVVIPELAYPDVGEASAWLCAAFGFVERLRIGNHRAQLRFGHGGAVVVTQGNRRDSGDRRHAVMVRVDDADAHHARAVAHGARILHPPTDHPYGERQYSALDPAGHVWTFSQSVADVDPADWGGRLLSP
ncbi:VOC family protein [Lysobacter sp.]|uniref:VOC family protein n=1 Tax=Lysobacter sp. TaxID=72226 RepID=UPI002D765612|nr:VOC family protein [Lysobacter sp.]